MYKIIKQKACNSLNNRYRKFRMNGKNEHTIAEYRAYYQRLIEAAKQDIALFEERLSMLDIFAADAKHIFPADDKYESWGLTEAALDAVKAICESGTSHPEGVETADINKYLVAHGFKVTDNFAVSLHVTLKRLSDKHDGRLLVTRDKYFVKRYKPGKISGTGAGVGNASH